MSSRPKSGSAVIISLLVIAALFWMFNKNDDTAPAATTGTGRALGAEELTRQINALPAISTADQAAASASYKRARFGRGWLDLDGNGCDTRDEILTRDNDGPGQVGADPDDPCRVDHLVIDDPFTGTRIDTDATGTAAVHIDHTVPLAEAWRSGASTWTTERRHQFANDPANLTAVSATANMSKGDQTPDEWMPDNTGVHCVYITSYVQVSTTYRVAVNPTTRAALLRYAAAC